MAYVDLKGYREPDDEPFIRNNMWSVPRSDKSFSIRVNVHQTHTWEKDLNDIETTKIAEISQVLELFPTATINTHSRQEGSDSDESMTLGQRFGQFFEPLVWSLLFVASMLNLLYGSFVERFPLTSMVVGFGALPLAIFSFRKARSKVFHQSYD
jgi:hypothetical protein